MARNLLIFSLKEFIPANYLRKNNEIEKVKRITLTLLHKKNIKIIKNTSYVHKGD